MNPISDNPVADDAMYRVVWRRDNGKCVPGTFHVLATVLGKDSDAAQAAAELQFPAQKGEIAVVPNALLDSLIADAVTHAEQTAKDENFERLASNEAAIEQQRRAEAQAAAEAKDKADAAATAHASAMDAARQRLGLVTRQGVVTPGQSQVQP